MTECSKKESDSELDSIRQQLSGVVFRHSRDHRAGTMFPWVSVHRTTTATELMDVTLRPSVSVVVSGRQELDLGTTKITMGRNHFLITPAPLPTLTRIVEASPSQPFEALVLELDWETVSDVAAQLAQVPSPFGDGQPVGPETVSRCPSPTGYVNAPLLRSIMKLMELLESPEDLAVLGPTARREIVYRLLVSDRSGRLKAMINNGHPELPAARAVEYLRKNFMAETNIGRLAAHLAVSLSSLHHQFKTLTGMSPLQYRKRLRLSTAVHLMVVDRMTASAAARTVGYRSVSQFSRDFRQVYGMPPLRHVQRHR